MIVRILVLAGLALLTLLLSVAAAGLYTLGEVRNADGWKLAALAAGGGAVITLSKIREYVQTR